jgi:hypothetical protein
MTFEVLDSLSLPGEPSRANEDAFAAEPIAAAVFDGATPVNDPLLPGRSDAAWIAQFGARRLLAHLKDGDAPRAALRHALADAEKSFIGLRRRPPQERYEIPCASMMLAAARDDGFDALWYGDCAALVLRPGGEAETVGHAIDKRATEAEDAAKLAAAKEIAPAGATSRAEFLPFFRAARARVNTPGGTWLFAPDAGAADHVSRARVAAPAGTLVLLCTDGFLALVGDYGVYDTKGLVEAAAAIGLRNLGEELRQTEEADPEGRRYPRFKKNDDATAVLLKIA